MTVTLTYESTLSRVKVTADGLGAAATALVERSLDQVTWTTVRCGLDAPTATGGVVTVYDYEFSSDVVNYYRVTSPKAVSFVGVGTAATANNTSVTPGLPAGVAAGDVMLLEVSTRTNGTPNVPTGYSMLLSLGNFALMGKIHSGSEVAPTVTFTGSVSGDDNLGRMSAFRNLQLSPTTAETQANSAQNIGYHSLTVPHSGMLALLAIWKQDDWTTASAGAPWTSIGDAVSTAGNDAAQGWYYQLQSSKVNVPTGSVSVTGGTSAASLAVIAAWDATTLVQTSSITPSITTLWLKSVGKPFLNRSFNCVTNISDITRAPRHSLFEIIGRSYPVAVTDLRQSREVTIELVTRTTQEHVDLDFILSLGESMFVHTPAMYPLPSMYVVINQTSEQRPLLSKPCGDDWRKFTLPLREVAAPGLDVCGSTVTWQSVINQYVTWQALQAGETSWLDLLTNVGSPADVIVP